MKLPVPLALLVALVAAFSQPAQAQQTEADVLKVVTTLFDGMKAKDTTKMRTTFAPNARLMSAGGTTSAPTITETPIDTWIA